MVVRSRRKNLVARLVTLVRWCLGGSWVLDGRRVDTRIGEGEMSSALRMVAALVPSTRSVMVVVLGLALVGTLEFAASEGIEVVVELDAAAAVVVVEVRLDWVELGGLAVGVPVGLAPRAAAREEAEKDMVVMVLLRRFCACDGGKVLNMDLEKEWADFSGSCLCVTEGWRR